ncbi:MAG TPA: MFS transporter [Candidatus Sulfotelmatobacter sp.]|nr:MFS transporter [Candidatus Sulfotelmatobacter sp.]
MATPEGKVGASAPAVSGSAWAVLRERPFRALWLADFINNLGFFAQAVGAGWLMTSLTSDAHVIALVQTATSLPLFVLAIPAGILADLVDRRRLIRDANILLTLVAAALAALTFAGHASVFALLAFTFVLGAIDALQEPAWGALIPEVVSARALPSAIALNGIGFNLTRVLGPPIAGFLVAVTGPAAAFAINAASFVPTIAVMRPRAGWRWPTRTAFADGFAKTWSVARTSVGVRRVLARNAAFSTCSSVLFALMPLLVREHFHGSAVQLGVLLGALGAGSVTIAQFFGEVRTRLGIEGAVFIGTVTLGACVIVAGCTPWFPLAVVALFVAGFGWLTVLSTLNTSIQFAVDPQHRAAGFALYLVTSQGINAVGAALWGIVASAGGVGTAFVAAGALFIILGAATRRIPLPWSQ